MNESSGSTAFDASGNAFHGTASGATRVAGVSGNAYSFDGSADFISLPDIDHRTDLAGGANGTLLIMAWVKLTSTGAANSYKMIATGLPGVLYFGLDPQQRLVAMLRNGADSGNVWPLSTSAIPLNKWTHVALMIQGSAGYKYYIDGKLDKSELVALSLRDYGTNQTSIGRTYVGGGTNDDWQGQIDNVRVYQVAF